MTRSDKITYLRIALSLQKIAISDETADRVIETYEKVLELKGDFNIKHALEIEMKMDRKHKEIEVQVKLNDD